MKLTAMDNWIEELERQLNYNPVVQKRDTSASRQLEKARNMFGRLVCKFSPSANSTHASANVQMPVRAGNTQEDSGRQMIEFLHSYSANPQVDWKGGQQNHQRQSNQGRTYVPPQNQ